MMISLDSICKKLFDTNSGLPVSASAVNAIHTCREGHPLAKERSSHDIYMSAAMAVEPYLGVNSIEVNWLTEQSRKK